VDVNGCRAHCAHVCCGQEREGQGMERWEEGNGNMWVGVGGWGVHNIAVAAPAHQSAAPHKSSRTMPPPRTLILTCWPLLPPAGTGSLEWNSSTSSARRGARYRSSRVWYRTWGRGGRRPGRGRGAAEGVTTGAGG
jgi:hypothetical protein